MRAYYDAELPTRTDPSTNSHRSVHLRDFVDTCRTWHLESVLEVGCGAGHDGRLIRAAGLACTGVDLSAVGVGLCVGLSLHAVQASAINLPSGTVASMLVGR
jgi:SAM-dependent methyltransferase